MGNTLDMPNTEKDSELYESSSGIQVGITAMQGWRLEMEDHHISRDFPSKPDHLLLAVFDGHAGDGAAAYMSQHLIEVVESSKQWAEYIRGKAQNTTLLSEALEFAFVKLDELLLDVQGKSKLDTSGCTSVVCVVTPTHIVCANAGDSRCVLGIANKKTKALSFDHKPNNAPEKMRIEAAGGFVQWNRVDGDLAVSRAMGDFSFKNRYDLTVKDQKVSCFPDITIHKRSVTDCVLLLACDGLWDVMSNEEAVQKLQELYSQQPSISMKLIAEAMVTTALDLGSKDNISAIVARLPGWT